MPSSQLIISCPLLLLPPIPPSIRVFSTETTFHMRWPKSWSFSFSIIPSKEIPGLISFRMDWLELLAVQGTPKGLLKHHCSKASILWCQPLFWGSPKSVQMVTAAMKLKALTPGRKVMTNLDSIFKSGDITLPTNVRLVKAMFFPVVMYGCESWTVKKAER